MLAIILQSSSIYKVLTLIIRFVWNVSHCSTFSKLLIFWFPFELLLWSCPYHACLRGLRFPKQAGPLLLNNFLALILSKFAPWPAVPGFWKRNCWLRPTSLSPGVSESPQQMPVPKPLMFLNEACDSRILESFNTSSQCSSRNSLTSAFQCSVLKIVFLFAEFCLCVAILLWGGASAGLPHLCSALVTRSGSLSGTHRSSSVCGSLCLLCSQFPTAFWLRYVFH